MDVEREADDGVVHMVNVDPHPQASAMCWTI